MTSEEAFMWDLIIIGLTVVLFAAAIAYVRVCDDI
jgi:hypothetical protein